jgi:YHS domain-containing protein/uncharacterized membrane protein YraQ (UPF0718 family)
MLALTIETFFVDIGHALRESAVMFYDTFWALVLGFTLSGAVQAFSTRQAMSARLGRRSVSSVLRATGYGMVSSSCSYAASAMAKSLVQKGADFLVAMVFMFASTNLVIELGIVLVVLIGWQFALGEFVGGAVMIGILVVVGSVVLRGPAIDRARRHLGASDGGGTATTENLPPLRSRLLSYEHWVNGANYAIADLTMLRRELVIGYLAAGFLGTLVPTKAWSAFFLVGHGEWGHLENAVVGPLIALISCVCSVGNIPLAAALWHGGISFGGVISFVFADLIALPLLLVYRRLYGGRMALRLLFLFWSVMTLAGLITETVFRAAGLVPRHHLGAIGAQSITLNYTAVLNMAFSLVAIALGVMHMRGRASSERFAIDPVCGMQVEIAHAPATRSYDAKKWHFCSDHCAERFDAAPDRYNKGSRSASQTKTRRDPICNMVVEPSTAAARRVRDGVEYLFCSQACAAEFDHRTPSIRPLDSR